MSQNFVQNKRVLILEGGGFKTGFTAGVMDAFHDANFRGFDGYVAVSGGTVALSYFLSEQRHGYIDALCHLVDDNHFIKFSRLFSKKGIMDVDYFHEVSGTIIPFDFDVAVKNVEGKEIAFVMTHRETGIAHYYRPKRNDWIDASIASCTLPVLTKGEHVFQGEPYFDGGWSDPIPAKWAYENGATELVIVRTKPIHKFIEKTRLNKIAKWGNFNHSVRRKIFDTNHLRYNGTLDFINTPPEGLTIHQIAPFEEPASGSLPKTTAELMQDHALGLKLGQEFLQKNYP